MNKFSQWRIFGVANAYLLICLDMTGGVDMEITLSG